MTAFVLAGAVLVAGLLPTGLAVFRGDAVERLAALELAAVLVALALAALAIGMGRPAYLDLAVAAALLSFGGGLVFSRFLERWL